MDYLYFLLIPFGIFWVLLAARPHDRLVWVAENVFTVIAIALMLWSHRAWPLGDLSYTLIVGFLVLHTVGGHYTYVRVPYDEAAKAIVGVDPSKVFGWVRNNYDRAVHFSYGLLLAYPFYDLLESYVLPHGIWIFVLSPALIMATSMIFEVLEWWITELLGRGKGAAYIGAQGDEWDAQKDMGLAALGSIIAMVVTAILG